MHSFNEHAYSKLAIKHNKGLKLALILNQNIKENTCVCTMSLTINKCSFKLFKHIYSIYMKSFCLVDHQKSSKYAYRGVF